ncbi:MAG: integrase family protein, partial [Thermomicrobiales bacterium]|nr:integrase family protein [Thermomicrobiales bacterium]
MSDIDRIVSDRTGRVSWRARFSYQDATGARRHRSKSCRTRREAEAWLGARQHELRSGDYLEPSREPFGLLMERYLARRRPEWASSTYVARVGLWQRYGAPTLSGIPLHRLTHSAIQNVYLGMIDGGLSGRTVAMLHSLIHQALADAVRAGMVRRNPADHARVAGPPPQTRTVWTPDEARRFWPAAEAHELAALWLLLLSTGMRVGEALALRWSDVDRGRGVVTIQGTIRTGYDRRPIRADAPKTAGSRRTVPLIAPVADALTAHRGRQLAQRLAAAAWQDGDLIFPTGDGGPRRDQSVNKALGRLCRRAGVPVLSPHELRHTGATVLIAAGVPLKVVSELLGHRSVT